MPGTDGIPVDSVTFDGVQLCANCPFGPISIRGYMTYFTAAEVPCCGVYSGILYLKNNRIPVEVHFKDTSGMLVITGERCTILSHSGTCAIVRTMDGVIKIIQRISNAAWDEVRGIFVGKHGAEIIVALYRS